MIPFFVILFVKLLNLNQSICLQFLICDLMVIDLALRDHSVTWLDVNGCSHYYHFDLHTYFPPEISVPGWLLSYLEVQTKLYQMALKFWGLIGFLSLHSYCTLKIEIRHNFDLNQTCLYALMNNIQMVIIFSDSSEPNYKSQTTQS